MSSTETSEIPAAARKEFRKIRKMLFIMFGSLAVYTITSTVLMAWSTQTSVPTRGIITGVDVAPLDSTRTDGGGSYEPNVSYRYDIAGVTYDGARFQIGGVSRYSRYTRERASLAANEYIAGDSVTVHVDPDDPTYATLRNSMDPMILLEVTVATLGFAMLYWFWMVWRPKRAGFIASYSDWY